MFAYDDPRLQVLIGAAGVDASVCYRLLNGQRRQVAIELGFSGQEIEAIVGIKAETLPGFARGLLGLTQNDQARPERCQQGNSLSPRGP